MMSDTDRNKVEKAKKAGRLLVGGIYKRTRADRHGRRRQRAEIRLDGVAGCLRTPGGGSSRQIVMIIDGENIRLRLVSGRETTRLMGLPDTCRLPANYNEAGCLTGDGVVVPVVRHLATHVLEPLLAEHGHAGRKRPCGHRDRPAVLPEDMLPPRRASVSSAL